MSDAVEIKITGNPSGAIEAFVKVKESARDFSREIGQVSQDVARELLQVAGITLSVKAALDAVGEGFKKGDEIRDLEMSLGVFSGSAEKGRQVMSYFESQMSSTRNTAHELAQTFRDEVPLAVSRGFSRESMQQITVWLSQFATVSHQSLESVESGFQNLLAGVIRNPAKNPILAFLGVSKSDIATLGWDQVINKIAEVASHAEDFGQSFESTMHKVHEAWFVAFGEGVNGALDGNRQAMANLKDALTDPAFIGALHDLGGEFASLVISMRDIVAGYRELRAAQEHPSSRFDEEHPLLNWFSELGLDREGSLRGTGLTDRTKNILAGKAIGSGSADLTMMPPGMPMFGKPYGTNIFGPPSPSTEQSLQSQLGVSTITGYGGDVHAFYARVASDLAAHKDQAKDIIESVKDEVHGSVIAWTDYSSSVQYAIKPTGDLAEETKKNAAALGLVKTDAEKTGQALLSLAKIFAEVTLKRDAVAASTKALGDYLDPKALALDVYSAAIQKNADEAAKEMTSMAEAAKKAGTAAPEVKKLRDQITGLNEDADSHALLAYMHAATSLFAKIDLTPADPFKQDFSLPNRSTADVLARIGLQPEDLSDQTAKQFGIAIGHAHGEEVRRLLLDQQFVGQLGDDFASIIESGGRNFIQILSSGLSSSVHESAQMFAAMIFGSRGNASSYVAGTNIHQDPNRLYDAAGNDITGRAQIGRGIMAGAEIAAGGYQAGFSGQPGARTGSLLSGAVSGAGIGWEVGLAAGGVSAPVGAVIGAVAGVIVSAIGSAVGAAQRQADYKYAHPFFDASGQAYLDRSVQGGDNIKDPQAKLMIAQMQTAFDSIHDALVKVILPFSKIALPPSGSLDMSFQPEASAHFLEHFDQMLHDTLPRAELALFKDDLKLVGVSLGMTSDAFDEYAKKIDNLDPAKQAAIYGQLFTGLKDIQAASEFTHFGGWNGRAGESDVWMAGQMAIGDLRTRTPGDLMKEADQQIIDLGISIKSLSPEGQAAAIQQLGQMEKARVETIKQAVLELMNVSEQFHAQAKSLHETAALGLMTRADGSIDYHAQADYEKKKADADLELLRFAHNAADAQKYGQQYLADVQKAQQFGMQDAANDPAAQKAWLEWLDQSATVGEKLMDQIIGQLGGTLNAENDRFNAALDPAIQVFLQGLKAATPDPYTPPKKGPGSGDPGSDPIIIANANLTISADGVQSSFTLLAPVVDASAAKFERLARAMDAFEGRLNSTATNSGTGDFASDPHQAFVASVMAERAA